MIREVSDVNGSNSRGFWVIVFTRMVRHGVTLTSDLLTPKSFQLIFDSKADIRSKFEEMPSTIGLV